MIRLLVPALVATVLWAAPVAAEELTVSAAVSMKDAVEAIGRVFVQAHAGALVRYNFGASGELQKQIEAGAPVDVFISAAARQMDDLEGQGLIAPGSRRAFARNVLVAVTSRLAALEVSRPVFLAEPHVTRIAVGNPRTVPAGQYTQEALRAIGLWERLRPKLIYAENVRQVLDWVSRGEVDVGFVYATDAGLRSTRVKEAFRPREDTYRAIVYPAAVVTGSRHPVLGRAFVERLLAADAQGILARFGFQPPPAGAR